MFSGLYTLLPLRTSEASPERRLHKVQRKTYPPTGFEPAAYGLPSILLLLLNQLKQINNKTLTPTSLAARTAKEYFVPGCRSPIVHSDLLPQKPI